MDLEADLTLSCPPSFLVYTIFPQDKGLGAENIKIEQQIFFILFPSAYFEREC